MKRAIVTGATGFLGHWLVRELLRNHISVTAVVRSKSHANQLLPENSLLQIVECPMEQYKDLPEKLSYGTGSVFYHLAWAGVSGSDRSSLNVQLANIQASGIAAEAAAAANCSAFVGVGTIMEDESLAVAATDGTRPSPGYLYGEAKHFSHLLTKTVCAQRGIPHIWAVVTNAYGEYERSPRFINTTLRKILHDEPLEFTAGTQMYDFIHVEDGVKALALIGTSGKPFQSYLIGSGQAAPLRVFVERLGKTLAPERALHFGSVPYTGVQLPIERFSIDQLTKDTGFAPRISFEEGLRRTMEWLKQERLE